MDEQEFSEEPKGKGFFTVALSLIDEMVKQDAGAEELMAYLILARGAGKRMESSWGANACATYMGRTNYRATQAINWLEEKGYISKSRQDLAIENSKKSMPKWIFKKAPDEELALANALVDGIGAGEKKPPLTRLDEIPYSKYGFAAAKLDLLMVMLHLYKHQSLADFGGINPRAGIYASYEEAGHPEFSGMTQFDLEGSNASIYEIKGVGNTVYKDFSAAALFYVVDTKERSERFWDAFNSLKDFGWLYETIQIWDADPKRSIKAQPLYTLYIKDKNQRESQKEPFLAYEIHKAMIKTDTFEPIYGFNFYDSFSDLINAGQFRYVAPKKEGAFPIGIYRLKFRPWTRDAGIGIAQEKQRYKNWEIALKKIARQAYKGF